MKEHEEAAARTFLVSAETAAKEVFAVSERFFDEFKRMPGFPAPLALGPRTTRWVRAELEAFALSLPRTQGMPAQLQAYHDKTKDPEL